MWEINHLCAPFASLFFPDILTLTLIWRHFIEFYWYQKYHQLNGHPEISGKWHLKCSSTVFGSKVKHFSTFSAAILNLTSPRPQGSNQTWLHIWKLTSWYHLTVVEVSCFSQKVHNFLLIRCTIEFCLGSEWRLEWRLEWMKFII